MFYFVISVDKNWESFDTDAEYLQPQSLRKKEPLPPNTPLYREMSTSSISSSPYTEISINRNIKNEIWFHGLIIRDNAESLIKQDGDFLIRESSSTHGQYVLTGMRDGVPRHLLLVDPNGNVSKKGRRNAIYQKHLFILSLVI